VDLLLYADTVRSPDLRHAVPVVVPDAFLYGEHRGKPFIVGTQLDASDVIQARPDAEFIDVEELGIDELLAEGRTMDDVESEIVLRACARLGVTRAAVPSSFPLGVADHLRAGGIDLVVDAPRFQARRRTKNAFEREGIRRAARAAEAGATAVAALLAAAEPGPDGILRLADGPLNCEALHSAAEEAVQANGAVLDDSIVAAGAQAATGHDRGSGPVRAGDVVVCDLWPRDRESGCFADFTRTFAAGGAPDEEIIVWHGLCRDALQRVLDAVAPGITGRDLWEVACDVFEAAGHPTQRSKADGEPLNHGFFHALGHGVGLEVHEHPALGRSGRDALVEGDVIAIEPGLYRPDFGGVRIEDTVLVTDDGYELLTRFDYELRI
jgi:Xaa-Pro aminopeptidase